MDLDESPPSSKCSNDSSDNAVNNNLRIKCVSEINSDPVEEESVSSVCCSKTSPISKTKRKLPAWMMMSPGSSSGSDSSSSKKTKTLNNADDAQEFPQMDVDPSIDMIQETAAPAIHNEPDDHDAIVDSTAVALTPHNDATLNPAVHTTTSTVISTTSLDSQPSGSSGNPLPSVKIKSEDNEAEAHQTSIVNSSDVNPLIKVKKEEATSSTREACKFGIRCYRRNPQHRLEMAHPGDHDYRRPNFPTPPDGTPDCPFGDLCYRRNPVHFKQFSHPPSTDFEQNWRNHQKRLRPRKQLPPKDCSGTTDFNEDSSEDDYDFEDPFINDEDDDEDFQPSAESDDEDYDELDKAEE